MSVREEEIVAVWSTWALFQDMGNPRKYSRMPGYMRQQAAAMAVDMMALRWNTASKDNLKSTLDRGRQLVYSLLVPSETPGIPREVRERARRVCKHYPLLLDERGY